MYLCCIILNILMMKKAILSCFAIILFMVSCTNGERILTSATGSIYECLVVMNNPVLTEAQLATLAEHPLLQSNGSAYSEAVTHLYDLVSGVMGADMPCMPQMESYFTLTHVAPNAFDDFLKPTRNILYVDINPNQYTQTKAKMHVDVWSTPQAYCHVQCPSNDEFIAWWLKEGNNIRDWFVRQELNRHAKFYKHATNREGRIRLIERIGVDMWIPEDYMFIMDTTFRLAPPSLSAGEDVDVLWFCNNKGPMRRDLVVYSYPYKDKNTFSLPYLNAQRDAVLGRIISGSVAGSYIGTEYKVFPPQFRALHVQKSGYAGEVRGLWKLYAGEAMGGPYVSHTRVDEIFQRVITAEVFIYASGQKKRNALRQAEAILYTMELPQEVNQIADIQISAPTN